MPLSNPRCLSLTTAPLTTDLELAPEQGGFTILLANKKHFLNKSKSVIHPIKGYLKPNRRGFQVAFLTPAKG